MPRDAYMSPYAKGALGGYCSAQNIMSRICLGRPLDGELIFYSSLFQAGIDRVVIVDGEIESQKDEIPERRRHIISCADTVKLRQSLDDYFN
jgi:hypothetical protein